MSFRAFLLVRFIFFPAPNDGYGYGQIGILIWKCDYEIAISPSPLTCRPLPSRWRISCWTRRSWGSTSTSTVPSGAPTCVPTTARCAVGPPGNAVSRPARPHIQARQPPPPPSHMCAIDGQVRGWPAWKCVHALVLAHIQAHQPYPSPVSPLVIKTAPNLTSYVARPNH